MPFFKINVAGTKQKVCISYLTPPPPLAVTFHFVATLNFVYGPLTVEINNNKYITGRDRPASCEVK